MLTIRRASSAGHQCARQRIREDDGTSFKSVHSYHKDFDFFIHSEAKSPDDLIFFQNSFSLTSMLVDLVTSLIGKLYHRVFL